MSVSAKVYIAPWVGYTTGGSVEIQDGTQFDLEASANLALTIETDLDGGRVGLFYANQSSNVETLNASSTIHYLHFQSSVYYSLQEDFSTYLGLGLGGSYVDADWVKDELGFSTSLFAGFEYQLSDAVALNSQIRWLGTAVDNETSGACNLPSNNNSCTVRFKTDWMDQFAANVGLVWSF
jgi:opacity protein-like surface antigen